MKKTKLIIGIAIIINIIILIVLLTYNPKTTDSTENENVNKEEKNYSNEIINNSATSNEILTFDNMEELTSNYSGELLIINLRIKLAEAVNKNTKNIGKEYSRSEAIQDSYEKGEEYDSFTLRVYFTDNSYKDFRVQYANYSSEKEPFIFEEI